MNPQDLMENFPDIEQFIIDCHEETEPGKFAFLAVVPSPSGEIAVWPFAYISDELPNPKGRVVGFIWEGSQEAANEWTAKNKVYLDKLNIERADALGAL